MDITQITTLDYAMILPLFVIGSILHFVYNWSRHNKGVAVIAAVNESYWEHIKIAFWPVILLYLFEYLLGGYAIASFIPAKSIALYTIPIGMIAIIFAYKHFTKKNVLLVDITVFLITIAIAQTTGALYLNELKPSPPTIILSVMFLAFLTLAFVIFTIRPPKEPDLFKDPLTSKYGLKGHR